MKKCCTKLWKIMKICAAHAMLATIVCGATFAHEMRAQILDKKVTVDMKDVTLEQALYRIEDASEVNIYFSLESLDTDGEALVTIAANDEPLGDILDNLLSPRHIRYKVDEKNNGIIILRYRRERSAGSPSERSASGSSSKSNRWDDPIIVTGTVTDAATQQPLAGVNVLVKGTTQGTTSDSEGRYIISADEDDVLVFSFIGFASVEMRISKRSTIDVSMSEDVKSLNEVVVNAGYYETTKELQTGSIGKIGSVDIEKQPIQNPLVALQGRIPGLEIIQQTGVPGGNFKVRIRGTNSIASGNDPLYIIDGVPYTSNSMSILATSGNILGNPNPAASQGSSPLNNLDPASIESIEVLKDADATAIYGSRGSNGVILITTKRGEDTKPKVDVNFYTGISQVANFVDLLRTPEYIEMRREAFGNDNVAPTSVNAPDLVVWETTKATNWQQELIGGTGQITDAQLSFSGTEGSTSFFIGSGFHRETTVFPGANSDRRISFHSSISNRSFSDKLRLRLTTSYTNSSSDMLNEDLTARALTLSPNAPDMLDEQGNLSWSDWPSGLENPLAFTRRKYLSNTDNLNANLVVDLSLTKKLSFKTSLGYTNIRNRAINTTPVSSLSPLSTQINSSSFSDSYFYNWIAEPQLNFRHDADFASFDMLLGTSFLAQSTEGMAQYASGFPNEALIENIGAASTIILATNNYAQYRYHAVYGRLNIQVRDRYILNLTGRRDGSSRFGPGKQFANFGAVGLAWIFSKEQILASSNFLSFGKVRASYGITGNDQIGDYQYYQTYKPSGTYQGTIGLAPQRLSNPTFAWEQNAKSEVAIDLGFLRDRILTTLGFYYNRSSSQLIGQPLSPTTGFSSVQSNLEALVTNMGFEFELNTINVNSSEFTWTTSINLTVPKTILKRFPELESNTAYNSMFVVGEPLSISKRYKATGVDEATGLYQFMDVNEDGSINSDDRTTIVFAGQDYYGGLKNTVKYKQLSLDFLFQFTKQSGNGTLQYFALNPGAMSNQPSDGMSRWQNPGDLAEYQKFTTGGSSSYANLKNSDKAITDASFLRLKNVAISFAFPAKILDRWGIDQLSLFAQGQNLLTFTKYDGIDPERLTVGLPPLRIVSVGFHLTM